MGIKYRINEDFFNGWASKMAYVLGYIYADGSLENAPYLRGKYLRITSVEKHAILRLKRWMNSRHSIVISKPTWPNGKQRFLLRIGSHKIYDALINLGLYPNKSLTIRLPEIPQNYLADFIRGYLDGDGCVNLYKIRGKKKKWVIKKLSITFTSGSRLFLNDLCLVLKVATDTVQSNVYKSTRSFQLRYGTADSIKLFKFLYANAEKNSYFKRKYKVFLNYFKLRPSKIDDEIKNIIENSLMAT